MASIVIYLSFCVLFASILHDAKSLSDNDTRVIVFAFMNITTDDASLDQFHSLHISSWKKSRFRLQIPLVNEDHYHVLDPNSISNPAYYEKTWPVDLSQHHMRDIHSNSFRIVSSDKVDVFASKAVQGSTDGFLALALTARSTEFYVPSFVNVPEGHSSFLVVSSYPDTCVEATVVKGGQVKRLFFKALGEFEVYQAYSQVEDYTGVYINATRPVSLFAGHECAQVPVGNKFCDHLIEQIPPVDEWGTVAIAGPIIGRNSNAGYILRVLPSEDATAIDIFASSGTSAISTATKGRGDYLEFRAGDAQDTVRIVCSKRCLVVQYNTGYFAPFNTPGSVPTDPFMMVVVPIDHYTNYMTFSTAMYWYEDGTKPFNNYLTVIARDSVKNDIFINQNKISTSQTWTRIVGTDFAVTALSISHGNYTVYHQDRDEKFVSYVYGHSFNDPTAYGYPTGYDIKGPPLPGDWWEEILDSAPTPGPVCTTPRTLPGASDRGPDQYFTSRAFLKYEATSSQCYNLFKITLRRKLEELKNDINFLICSGQMCTDTDHAFVNALVDTKYVPEDRFDLMSHFEVSASLVTSLDDTVAAILSCKRQLVAFLSQTYNWKMPLDIAGCPQLEFDDWILVTEQFNCPVGAP